MRPVSLSNKEDGLKEICFVQVSYKVPFSLNILAN
jgi:hypothetical protein